MVLTKKEIKDRKIIQSDAEKNYTNISYDLTVDKIITRKGKIFQNYEVPPNSLVTIISKESVVIPKNIVGHAYVKTSLSQKGIMANNIGLIDPDYSGSLSSVIVNFGKSTYPIKKGDTFLRLSFTNIRDIDEKDFVDRKFSKDLGDYLNSQRSNSMEYLGNSFVNVNKIIKNASKEVRNSVIRYTARIGLIVGILALLIASLTFYLRMNSNNELKDELKSVKEELDSVKFESLRNNYDDILKKNSILRMQRDSLMDVLNSK